ncbi:MAG: hypothetical protein D6715_12845 [Calditrichaeota bacterium]|nr:MAG: hypothetical protein D6715_12845 [Calditrichota bacterium]
MKLSQNELNLLNDQISEHMNHILKCTVPDERYGRLLLASPPDRRYPYIYPRDVSSACQLFRRVAGSRHQYDAGPTAFQLLEAMARFMKDVQRSDGFWGQRYSLQGEDKSIYKQEDNIAHGIAILCNYLLTAHRLQKPIPDLQDYLQAVDKAVQFALKHNYHSELNLFYSTTAIHESAIEEGYTCWVNLAYQYAFMLTREVDMVFQEKSIMDPQCLELCAHFEYSVRELFMAGDRYFRRFNKFGHMDLRPDVTLLSPFYFGYVKYTRELERSVAYIESHLCDPELGMVMRYLPFYKDFDTHVHAGNGPWLQYTAILAQYHFWNGNRERGEQLLNMINQYRNEQGEIPEHLSTCERFYEFMEKEWRTGIDFEKEFYKPILLDNLDFGHILEEANNMARSYKRTGEKCMILNKKIKGGGYIQFATPLMWSHVEYARALLVRAGDWWRMRN